ncbi:MAG: polysaccharide deacetylase family protein [Oscillospiraceae bacterium]|nr:polysaccharide deacetylase family protein [Oscillospiraceae bacterium]
MKRIIRFGALFFAAVLLLQALGSPLVFADNLDAELRALQELVEELEELDGRAYTNATWRGLIRVRYEAQMVLDNQWTWPGQLRAAYDDLQGAAAALVPMASIGNPFSDVGPRDWFYPAVRYVSANGIMQGSSATRFDPNSTLSRAMVATVLHRMEGAPPVEFAPIFSDVAPGEWYSDAIIWAAHYDIVYGVGNGRFAPHDRISREQLVTMLRRYAAFKGYPVDAPAGFSLSIFSDGSGVSDWAADSMRWAMYFDLLPPIGNRLNSPLAATRADSAIALQRFIDRLEFNRLPAELTLHHIPWRFFTYLEPDFRGAKQEALDPQIVQVLGWQEDGWALVQTADGERWVYLRENKRFIEQHAFLYDSIDGRRGNRMAPQEVIIYAEEGDWLQISTWQGPQWLYLGNTRRPGDRLVALTFDDGPGPYTDRLLDALYERGVPATFFVLGQQVMNRPDTARRIVNEGHEIASHTFRHPQLTRMNAGAIRAELARGRTAIQQITGETPTLFRPPYGAHNATVRSVAAEFGYPVILWSVDTLDWRSRNVNTILGHFVDRNGNVRIRDGDVILMHDIHRTSVDAAIRAVDLLLAEGFVFVTTSELLIEQHGMLVPGRVYNR